MNRSRPGLLRWLAGVLALLAATAAAAHDFWIEPASFSPLPGQTVAVRLLVGEHLSGEPVARPPAASLHRFVLADVNSQVSVTLPGRTGADPAGRFRLAAPGLHVIGYHGKPLAIELPADKFNAYLVEEGLESILALRRERGQLDQPVREIYSRCAKSLVVAGPLDMTGLVADRALGFTLELIAEKPPWQLRDGEPLPVRLLHEGSPLAGALVLALHHDDPRNPIALRSDGDGRVQLPLARKGAWLVKAVHMRPAAAGSGADWESLWASLSFSRGGAH